MAGWAYSNFGEQQELDQDDQLRSVAARAAAEERARSEESEIFRSALAAKPAASTLSKPVVAPSISLRAPIGLKGVTTKVSPTAKPALPAFMKKKRPSDAAAEQAGAPSSAEAAAKRSKAVEDQPAAGDATSGGGPASADHAGEGSRPEKAKTEVASLVAYDSSSNEDE